ncbi:hypothetical protein [Loktanella sp. S4079]|uniref:hypothetical protein n=1 Tax=Loktanella sp. S4079 TaxID=579483 RepID=UPI0005F9FDD6|nr:hypothetical protein [Loktanella sp. S4079]KJZ19608.1 hypothetical protein TW80_01495 [Loktanella sp. S4079]
MVHMVEQKVTELSALLEEKLRVRGSSFATQVRKAGRTLPRHIRRDMKYLIESAELVQNPKLARMVNEARVERAHRNAVAYLNSVDPWERRKTTILNITASVAFVLIVVGALLLYVLVQRGYV